MKNLPKKYQKIWDKAKPLFEQGRPGDEMHAEMTVQFILAYKGKLKLDYDVLVPAAILHDIGHAAILPAHFKFITGGEKLENGKLVHMLAGAKIAAGILTEIGYDNKKTKEIVDIISIHDADQLKGVDLKAAYNSKNKKIFHDIDSLDRFNDERLTKVNLMYKNKKQIYELLEKSIEMFFYEEFKKIAKEYFKTFKID